MIIVTGGAGFIGSNIIQQLNKQDKRNILVVDDMTDGTRFKNLADLDIGDYWDADQFLTHIQQNRDFGDRIEVIFHQGACSITTEWNGKYMMNNNFAYSKSVLHYCSEKNIPLIYASSAAVYGGNKTFRETREHEAPLNVYGYSKMLFDHYVRTYSAKQQIVGLRYFNVYGPREQHKGSMASVAFHFNNQLKDGGELKLFAGCDGYSDGEQLRDFVYVEDVANVNLWCWQNPNVSGIFNVGTGRAQTFNDVANAVIAWHKNGKIVYIPFPAHLKGHYQSYTEADISALRKAGYSAAFRDVAEGVAHYLDCLNPCAR